MLDIFLMMLNDTASMLDKPSASSKGMLDKFLIILDKRRFILNIFKKMSDISTSISDIPSQSKRPMLDIFCKQ